ncbi:hypothetical protein COOONC_15800 [Cooperia oncophora]
MYDSPEFALSVACPVEWLRAPVHLVPGKAPILGATAFKICGSLGISTVQPVCDSSDRFGSVPLPHEIHRFNECFGVLGVLDYIHDTAKTFRSSVYFKRHITYFSLQPIKEIYPDK